MESVEHNKSSQQIVFLEKYFTLHSNVENLLTQQSQELVRPPLGESQNISTGVIRKLLVIENFEIDSGIVKLWLVLRQQMNANKFVNPVTISTPTWLLMYSVRLT